MARKPIKGPKIAFDTTEHLDPGDVVKGFEKRASREPPMGLLMSEARRRGYMPETKAKDVWGVRRTLRLAEDLQPPKGSSEAPVRELSVEIDIQSFTKPKSKSKPKSKDQCAVMTITTTAGGNHRQTLDMLLEAPGGDLAHIREYKVKGNAVVRAHSTTDTWLLCMQYRGDWLCGAAMIACVPIAAGLSIAGYLFCIAYACIGVWTLCAWCAACRCVWPCKIWPIGCCR